MAVVTLEELFKSSPRREIIQSSNKSCNNKNKKRVIVRNKSLLETLAKNGDITSRMSEDGTMKMKILVKKQDLKQMLETMDVVGNNNNKKKNSSNSARTPPSSSSSLSLIERRLYDLMKKRRGNNNNQGCQGQHLSSWRPALQSIPEEHY